jgi:hypothetical protein
MGLPIMTNNLSEYLIVRLAAFLGCLFFICVADCNAEEVKTTFPVEVAFNRGVFKKSAIEEAKKKKQIEILKDDEKETVIQHFWIEVFENSHLASKKQTTVFAVCQSTFYISLSGSKALTNVKVSYIVLDAAGKPLGDSWRLEFKGAGDSWAKSLNKGEGAKAFHAGLSEFIKNKLYVVSGFLDNNPGQQPVAFKQDIALSVISNVFGFVPGMAKAVLGQLIESAIRTLSVDGLRELVKKNELRWGRADDVTDKKALQFAPQFQEVGKSIWQRATDTTKVKPLQQVYYIEHALDVFFENDRPGHAFIIAALNYEYEKRKDRGLPYSTDEMHDFLRRSTTDLGKLNGIARTVINDKAGINFRTLINAAIKSAGSLHESLQDRVSAFNTEYITVGGRSMDPYMGLEQQKYDVSQTLTYAAFLREKTREELKAVFETRESDAAFRVEFDKFYADILGVIPETPADEILNSNAMLPARRLTSESNQHLARIHPLLKQAMADGNLTLEELPHLVEEAKKLVAAASAMNVDVLRLLELAKKGIDISELLKKVNNNREKGVEDIREGSYVLATLVGFFDKDLARNITLTVEAYTKIAEAMAAYQAGQATASATSGHVILAFIGLIAKMEAARAEATAFELLSSQITEVSKQIKALHEDFLKGIEHIDKNINLVYKEMVTSFDLLNHRLALHEKKFDDILHDLKDLDARVRTLDNKIGMYFQTLTEEARMETYNRCISPRERHPNNPTKYFSPDRFDICLSDFRHWAVKASLNKFEVGLESANQKIDEFSIHDPQVMEALLREAEDPLERIYLLGRLAAPLGNPNLLPSREGKVPNVYVWSLGSNAYMRTIALWHEYSNPEETDVDPDLDPMIREGVKLRNAVRNVTVDEAGVPQPKLFENLIENYNAKVDQFLKSINKLELDYRKAAGISEDFNKLNLWAKVDQKTAFARDPEKEMMRHTMRVPPPTEFRLPKNFESVIPGPYLLAEHLGLGRFQFLYLPMTERWGLFVYCYFYDKNGKQHYVFNRRVLRNLTASMDAWEGGDKLRDRFIAESINGAGIVECLSPDDEPCHAKWRQRVDSDLASITGRVSEVLESHRVGVRQELITKLASANARELKNETVLLSSSEILLKMFVQLGLSASFNTNDGLRGAFLGDMYVPGALKLMDAHFINTTVLTQLAADKSASLDEVRAKIRDESQKRVNKLRAVLLDDIMKRQNPSEPQLPIEDTLLRLEALRDERKRVALLH